jgi:hypothetical protein
MEADGMLATNPSGDGVVPYPASYGVGTTALGTTTTAWAPGLAPVSTGTSDSAFGSSSVSPGVSGSSWGAGFVAAGGCALSAAATLHGDDFRLQRRRFQFGDFSGGDFSDHGEFSNMGLKATKRTTIRWDDGMPPPTGRDC